MHKKFLKLYYFIEEFKKSNIDKQHINTSIIYRNYKKKYKINDIISLRDYCRNKNIKFYLANNIKLSINLNLDGAYLPSFNQSFSHLSYNFKKNFVLIGSAHNFREIAIKVNQGCELILLSKLFLVDYNKSSPFLAIVKFNFFSKIFKILIPLGGIKTHNLNHLKNVSSEGFALLSEVKKKPAKIISRLF